MEPLVDYDRVKKEFGIVCKNATYQQQKEHCAITVKIVMDILQIRDINEERGVVRLLMVFRQMWQDNRLQMPAEYLDECPLITEVNNDSASYVPAESMQTVWFPDVYINRIESVYRPEILMEAQTFRANRDGNISDSMFGTFTLSCPMDFRNFPMDVQFCPLYIESWRLQSNVQKIMWDPIHPVGVAKDYSLDQFSFGVRVLDVNTTKYTSGEYSRIGMTLIFSRELQFYILQIYFPTVLFVIISWLTFIIPPSYAQGRIILTITTMLTLAALFSLVSMHSPSTSYLKAIDVWMFVCFTFVFAAVVDCLVDIRIHFVESQAYKEGKLGFLTPVSVALVENREVFSQFFGGGEPVESSTPATDPAPAVKPILKGSRSVTDDNGDAEANPESSKRSVMFSESEEASTADPDDVEVRPASPTPPREDPSQNAAAGDGNSSKMRWEHVAFIFEKWSMVLYPCSFLLFNLCYWGYYLNASHPPPGLAKEIAGGFTPAPRVFLEVPSA